MPWFKVDDKIHDHEKARKAGWRPVAVTDGGTWSRPSRKRSDRHPLGRTVRWECPCSDAPAINLDSLREAS